MSPSSNKMEVKSPVTSSSSTQASIIKTFRSSSKSFATSLASSISSIAGSIASGLMSIITFPASYISMALSPRKDEKKKRRVTLRVKHPKWMKFVDWFVSDSGKPVALRTKLSRGFDYRLYTLPQELLLGQPRPRQLRTQRKTPPVCPERLLAKRPQRVRL